MTWRPIATAPRDGTYIIVAGPSGYTTTPLRAEICRQCPDYKAGRWITHSNDDFTDGGEVPTLWMPLPATKISQIETPLPTRTVSRPDPQAAADRPRELVAELESIARQSDDAAASCQAIYDRHYPKFRALTERQASAEDHDRLMELYGHVFPNRDQAKRMLKEAVVLRRAVSRLRRYEAALRRLRDLNLGPDQASATYRCGEAASIAGTALGKEV